MRIIVLLTLLLAAPIVAVAGHESGAPIWIDVRTAAEFEGGHLPGARNIDFDHIGERIAALTDDREHPIILYCKSGRRSGFAKQTLERLGYTNVVNAGGVMEVLRRAGHEPELGPDCVTREC